MSTESVRQPRSVLHSAFSLQHVRRSIPLVQLCDPGTNDDSRVGQAVTGGCINVNQSVMAALLKTVQLGDEVVINSDTPCTLDAQACDD